MGTRPRIRRCFALTGLLLAPPIFPFSIASATSQEVRVTAIVKEADLVTNDAGRRAALVGDPVRIGNEIIQSQQEEKSNSKLIETNLVISGSGSSVSVVDPANGKTPKSGSAILRPSEEVRP